MGSDMDDQEVDAIVDEYIAEDEDEEEGRLSLVSTLSSDSVMIPILNELCAGTPSCL